MPVRTGTKVYTTSDDSCESSIHPCLLIDPDSTATTSHIFSVQDGAKQLRVFGLSGGEKVIVEYVWGAREGEFVEPMVDGGVPVELTHPSNYMLLPYPGRYRVRLDGDTGPPSGGGILVVCEDIDCCSAQTVVAHQSNLTGES